jgi:hypothetical protein
VFDIQVVTIRDILTVYNVRPYPNFDPPTLIIRGKDFNSVYEVLINEVASPSVVVLDNQQLLAQIPDVDGDVIRSIVVLSRKLTKTDRSKLSFQFDDSPVLVGGLERLIQTFLKLLLQTPGTDIFAPKVGGGLLGAIGKQATYATSSIVSDVHIGVQRTSKQLLQIQAREPAIALEERLLYARVIEAKFLVSQLAMLAKIQIGNQAGKASTVGLGL